MDGWLSLKLDYAEEDEYEKWKLFKVKCCATVQFSYGEEMNE